MSITLQECIVCSFIHYTAAAAAAVHHILLFFAPTPYSTPQHTPHYTTPHHHHRKTSFLLPPSTVTNQPNKNKNKNNAHLLDPPHGPKTSSRSNFNCQTRRGSFGREVARTFSWYVYGIHPSIDSFPIVFVSLFSPFIHSSHWGKHKYRLTGTATDQDKCPTKRAIVEHVAKLKRSMGIGGVKGKVKVKGDEVQEEEEDDGLGKFEKCGKKEKMKMKKMKGTMASSGTPTRLRGKDCQGKGSVSSRSTRDMTDDELDDEHVLEESRIKNEDAEYASLPFTVMMADDDTPCPTPRSTKVWDSIPWMFDEEEEDEEEAETERDDCNTAVPLPPSVEEVATKISGPLTTLPLLSSSSSTKEDDTPKPTKRSKTSHQEKSSPTIITSTATFPKNTSSSSSTPTTYSNILSPPNPSSSATTTIQEKEELDKQQDPNANSYSNDLFVSPFCEIAQAETTAISTGELPSSLKMKKKMMKEKEKKRSYHIVDIDAAYCSRGNKKRLKRSNDDDDDDDDVGGGSSSSSKVGGRGTRKKRIPLAVLEDYPVGQ